MSDFDMSDSSCARATQGLNCAIEMSSPGLPMRRKHLTQLSADLPRTTLERQQASLDDQPFDFDTFLEPGQDDSSKDETVLYLGYGSNLAAETFLGKRGIRPLSQVNIVAPAISLTFDLPGLPYSEPCFGNSRYRTPDEEKSADTPGYHKDAWKKGLVGVVYEVTKKDYAHIIATEGGGSGYHDVLVDCYELDDDPNKEVPAHPTGASFKAHTLYAHRARPLRKDPSYAQPSARYLKLITDGAQEHDLPQEYRHFLANIRPYKATTTKQQLGSFLFIAIWGPFLLFFFGSAKLFLRPNGTYPPWFAKFTQAFFAATWASYDEWFKPMFGDGERTIGDEVDKGMRHSTNLSEKTPLLARTNSRHETVV